MELQQHISLFQGLDIDIYAVSVDSPDNHKQLHEQGNFSIPFLSDPDLNIIKDAEMRNQGQAFRGYALFDANNELVFNHKDDNFGDNIQFVYERIRLEYEGMDAQ